jgi:hypothetical protein
MKNELRCTLLVLCYCGMMLLVYSMNYSKTCTYGDNMNSLEQGCVSGEYIKNGLFGLVNLVFLVVISLEVWWAHE